MLGKTHAAAGICAGIGLTMAVATSPLAGAVIIGESWLGSLFPDIDHKNSKISKKLKLTGFIARLFAGHRTLFHNPLTYAAVYAILRYFRPDLARFLVPLFMGIGTHLFLDTLTPMGIPLLPNLRLHIGNIRTGSGAEHAIYSFLTVAGFGISAWAIVARGLL